MRWISFFILAYVVLGLQTGISAAMQWRGSGPNLVLLAVVFIAINAPRDVALLGSFILGAMQDLCTQGTMGLYALSYGLVAMFVVTAQQAVYREHPLTHFSMTLIAGLMTAGVLYIHDWLRPPGAARVTDAGQHLAAVRYPLLPMIYTAVYTALLGVVVLGLLQRSKRVFQFQAPRRQRMTARGR
ncbi:MAG: rod shape-determining protein MreD [Planctomycetota bacterium]|nr:rod shape-determining protein MreD [Planctomycetota bacterium]